MPLLRRSLIGEERLGRFFAIEGYFALAGGTMPFMRRYSTICP